MDYDPTARTSADSTAIPLTPEDIEEFRSLIKAETGEVLNATAAWQMATELLALVRVLISPLPEDTDGAHNESAVDLPRPAE